MKFTCGLTSTLPLLLVLLLVVATKGHTDLKCYVCDNCEKITKLTPLEQCGGEHHSTTTTTSTPMPPTTTTSRTSTSMALSDSTARLSTENPITTNTTVELSTPSLNGFPSTTITPPTTIEEKHATMLDNNNTTSNASSTAPPSFVETASEGSSIFAVDADSGLVVPSGNITEGSHNRQRRHTEFNGITYYCYKIQKKYDNGFGTQRGCIGVKTERSACDELDMNNNNQTSKCTSCTKTMCNGSSALGVSIATLLVALLAVIYKV